MPFEWDRIHKHEEDLERDAQERAVEHVMAYYSVREISELTAEQVAEIENFQSSLNAYSVMQHGLNHVVHEWHSANA